MHPADTALSHARLPSSSAAIGPTSKRKGLSLVETAIVLGIVGLVVGGIWVAAAQFIEKNRIERMEKAIVLMLQGVKSLYPLPQTPPNSDLSSLVISAGFAPRDMVNGNQLVSPWGTRFYIGFSNFFGIMSFYIYAPGVPVSACIDIVSSLKLGGVQLSATTWGYFTAIAPPLLVSGAGSINVNLTTINQVQFNCRYNPSRAWMAGR